MPGVRVDPRPSATQRAEWFLQRGTRFVFGAIVVAALLGLFGQGLLSGAVAESDGVRATYERFVRHEAQVAVQATPSGDELMLLVRGIIEPTAVVDASPAPLRQRITADGRELIFSTSPGEPSFITLRWTPATPGVRRGEIAAAGARIDLWFFVFP